MLHWRTTKGAEVDFIIESSQQVLPIEVKATRRVRTCPRPIDCPARRPPLHGRFEQRWYQPRLR
ncbi:MAG: DUF4143 domain-containing protein [Gemmatimonadetes bacterium]|nr:DUF4143 domain-containing protein [Gemmatimonadota bacterium]MCH8253906.1 DUF4143 domain-containing protein [Gemmatimonadota bacterium]MCH8937384.1 DUF4143 domain-containing protein [Gemmatimonadota bacterium]